MLSISALKLAACSSIHARCRMDLVSHDSRTPSSNLFPPGLRRMTATPATTLARSEVCSNSTAANSRVHRRHPGSSPLSRSGSMASGCSRSSRKATRKLRSVIVLMLSFWMMMGFQSQCACAAGRWRHLDRVSSRLEPDSSASAPSPTSSSSSSSYPKKPGGAAAAAPTSELDFNREGEGSSSRNGSRFFRSDRRSDSFFSQMLPKNTPVPPSGPSHTGNVYAFANKDNALP